MSPHTTINGKPRPMSIRPAWRNRIVWRGDAQQTAIPIACATATSNTLSAEGVGWPGLNDVQGPQWIFSVIFDYTSASSTRIPSTAPTDISQRHLRVDPFSTHRAGFEVRTYRLCHRVLMFHHFEELGATKYLVRSTDFEYDDRTDLKDLEKPGYSVLKSVTQRAYQKRSHNDATYESCPLPPVGFTYSEPRVDETVQTSESSDLEIF